MFLLKKPCSELAVLGLGANKAFEKEDGLKLSPKETIYCRLSGFLPAMLQLQCTMKIKALFITEFAADITMEVPGLC